MAGYRLIALAIVVLAGAILATAGATPLGSMQYLVSVGLILMSVSGLWLLIDLVLTYITKK